MRYTISSSTTVTASNFLSTACEEARDRSGQKDAAPHAVWDGDTLLAAYDANGDLTTYERCEEALAAVEAAENLCQLHQAVGLFACFLGTADLGVIGWQESRARLSEGNDTAFQMDPTILTCQRLTTECVAPRPRHSRREQILMAIRHVDIVRTE